ncbi:hypothetical protein [Pontibacter chitinilyticus]|uniref:hypothetical protein n=1 Tax=Pontibacter chitinilyticus TaxID=2674989 RepID=UPI00321AB6A7
MSKETPHVSEQYMLFFGAFALIWAVVSGFTHFIIRVDGFITCGRKVANLLNAFVLHALLLLGTVVIFDLSYLPVLPLLYTYGATAALILLSRMLLYQVLSYMKSAVA